MGGNNFWRSIIIIYLLSRLVSVISLGSLSFRTHSLKMSRNLSRRYRVLILCAIINIVDVEVEGRVGATEKHHDVRHNEGEVVVAASEVELWLHERSDLNHNGRGQANYEQNRRHHQRFRQSSDRFLSVVTDVVTDPYADDVELRCHWTTRRSLTAVMVVVTAMVVKKSEVSTVE